MNIKLFARILRMYVRQINMELDRIQKFMPRESIYFENGKEKCEHLRGIVLILCDMVRLSDELRDSQEPEAEPRRDDSDTRYTVPEIDWGKIPAKGEYGQ